MARVALISCSKLKLQEAAPARELYAPSSLFKLSLAYCLDHYDKVFVLSAKYGFLKLDDVVEPYELTLKTMPAKQRRLWAQRTMLRLSQNIGRDDVVYWHCGVKYREYIMPLLSNTQHIPLFGMKHGRQMEFYKQNGY